MLATVQREDVVILELFVAYHTDQLLPIHCFLSLLFLHLILFHQLIYQFLIGFLFLNLLLLYIFVYYLVFLFVSDFILFIE